MTTKPILVVEFTPYQGSDQGDVFCDWCEKELPVWFSELLEVCYCEECMAMHQERNEEEHVFVGLEE